MSKTDDIPGARAEERRVRARTTILKHYARVLLAAEKKNVEQSTRIRPRVFPCASSLAYL